MTGYQDFLAERVGRGGFSTEDTLAVFLPLLRQVIAAHDADLVAPLDGVAQLHIDGNRIWFAEADRREMRFASRALRRIAPEKAGGIQVVSRVRQVVDISQGDEQISNALVASPDTQLERPAYVLGFRSYEHALGHHDPVTDTFVLGLILASLALGLDMAKDEDLRSFVDHRDNLFALDPKLNPFLAKVIRQMTELRREDRPQDLSALADSLVDYREQDVDIELDLLREAGFLKKDLQGRHQIILSKLQQRLFEISRRNRLLHFRTTQQSVNLTNASVPLSFDPERIRAEQIVTWSGRFADAVCSGKKVLLNKYLNFEEALYLPSLLDKIRAEARKDQAEYGFAQLRLVICFLRWANLKEDKERFDSPLLLLPVKLTKKKGVRDAHQLEALSTEAEVNPVLRHYLHELYGLELPELVDLETADLHDLHRLIEEQVRASESAVSVELIDKPRISLIHRKARQRLDQFQKRSRLARRGTRTYPKLDYSYTKSDFRPLGLQLFRQKVQLGESALEAMFHDARPREHSMSGTAQARGEERTREAQGPSTRELVREVSQEFYQLETEGSDNPYRWEFDLCSVTLGNFRYRRMSLVRDYEALLQQLPEHAAFDAVFSLEPPPQGPLPEVGLPFERRYPVVPCDPTQSRAISFSNSGDSYIIQGPPGTGKSQTITNLIAEFVAQGKRVLFVCEKRAAIDVVYHRLEQCGLGSLCCLVHDAQADKKELIMNLAATYDEVTTAKRRKPASEDRASCVEILSKDVETLDDHRNAMLEERDRLGQALRASLVRALELRDGPATPNGDSSPSDGSATHGVSAAHGNAATPDSSSRRLSAVEREALPSYADFVGHRENIERLYAALRDSEASGVYRRHPLRLLSPRLADSQRAATEISEQLEPALDRLSALNDVIQELPEACQRDLGTAERLVAMAIDLSPLASKRTLGLLDPTSAISRDFDAQLVEHERLRRELEVARENASGWRDPLARNEVANAKAQAERLEGGLLSFLKPAWWRLRKIMRRCYDFDKAVVRPTWAQALDTLEAHYAAEESVERSGEAILAKFGVDENRNVILVDLRADDLAQPQAALRGELLARDGAAAAALIDGLVGLDDELGKLRSELGAVLVDFEGEAPPALSNELRRLHDQLDALPEFSHSLLELRRLPEELAATVRCRDWTETELESALIEASLFSELRGDRRISRFDGRQRDRLAEQLEEHYDRWLDLNASSLHEAVRQQFLDDHALIETDAKDLEEDDKARKKTVTKGLKTLQHEFKKTRRYKSIRDLSAGESGEVLAKLKPVWLMSPLSVSDTLPMTTERFDVVIFDEASQITLEEAVPSIFRAAQIIVVGDEMQLPPTNFFSARARPDEESDALEESVEYELDGNSFLTHAARNLRSCMLGWHYRSRSESLISFSNQAFYGGELLTVPDEQFAAEPRPEILVERPEDGAESCEQIFARPVGFHLLSNGVYESRRNRAEAEYIAELVRGILALENGTSIGVVAFSQAQQGEIEEALDRLAASDPSFRERLEAEYEREEDDQFVGLLVKNLENIQGDERDVVIMSVCYGPNPRGKVRMNFGPINLSGGEKRLNVAFSRAKSHMVLVASMRSTAITNDYNVGANCLKNYLAYAERSSIGDAAGARRVLEQLRIGSGDGASQAKSAHPAAAQLADAIRAKGYRVDLDVGQSDFRCSLAIRHPSASRYALGVLIDGEDYFAESDTLERDMMKPRLLRAFGWKITHVLSKDWHKDPESELARVLELLD